ncbi:hypothetical protein A2154_00955 [Candidatus Gottesmanbacteria bacterium RBG_16_43_7]|uniref:UDP-N-acetylglucosamine--N-acetylmuramyl-(pentapeptide) pyrophosphoryl-undecaprenol N-acetylglucosamine transferase n=1 Tax=Candidatus Gottesmanbacteria bacterium RBG_16_43_7 TaxID=1798373 RepID=A0A1F5Z8R3_9BACT|nr:MAG: hypothetical protein A2154_00955 [Candidatus Gottesmanbacteria bacterium RBG_16_43_7]
MKKVIISGGHLTPAVSVIYEIKSKHPDWSLLFIGRKTATETEKVISEEYRIIRNMKIPFEVINSGRLSVNLSLNTMLSIFKIPWGMLMAYKILRRQQPDIVVTFGGYIGLAVGLAAKAMRIKLIIHEQAAVPGLANLILAPIANRICISYPFLHKYFPVHKTILTGIPVRDIILAPPPAFSLKPDIIQPILYFTGGATGSKSINELIYPIVARLIRNYTVVHQTGRAWINQARVFRFKLRGDRRGRYIPVAYLDGPEHAWLLHHSRLVISRSGANTVAEIAATGVAAIFIPLPWSRKSEQLRNAQMLSSSKHIRILDQTTLTATALYEQILISKKTTFPNQISAPAIAKAKPQGEIVSLIENELTDYA